MLIVVTDASMRDDEAEIINALFGEGLELLHLRKPSSSTADIRQLLTSIKAQYYGQISLHQRHKIAEEFGIKRLHFREEKREKAASDELRSLKAQGFTLSTSIHRMREAKNVASYFEYAMYGPLFNSISKEGYTPTEVLQEFSLPENGRKIVGIGGIDETNIAKVFGKGFAGAAILGAVWKDEDPLIRFKQIRAACSSIAP